MNKHTLELLIKSAQEITDIDSYISNKIASKLKYVTQFFFVGKKRGKRIILATTAGKGSFLIRESVLDTMFFSRRKNERF